MTRSQERAEERAARSAVIELRRQGLSVHEISACLAVAGTPLNRTGGQILAEEGLGRLMHHPEPEASISPATTRRDNRLLRARVIDLASFPAPASTRLARKAGAERSAREGHASPVG